MFLTIRLLESMTLNTIGDQPVGQALSARAVMCGVASPSFMLLPSRDCSFPLEPLLSMNLAPCVPFCFHPHDQMARPQQGWFLLAIMPL